MIIWKNRLDPTNHHFAFPVGTTGIVDCFPIRVLTPRKWAAKKFLYAPKYKCCILKVQIVVTFTGSCRSNGSHVTHASFC